MNTMSFFLTGFNRSSEQARIAKQRTQKGKYGTNHINNGIQSVGKGCVYSVPYVVKTAKMICTGCPGVTREIQLPPDESKLREELDIHKLESLGTALGLLGYLPSTIIDIVNDVIPIFDSVSHRDKKGGQYQMTYKDNVPDINIPRWPSCLHVPIATSCPMIFPTPWNDYVETAQTLAGYPLTMDSFLMCAQGGVVTFVSSGQTPMEGVTDEEISPKMENLIHIWLGLMEAPYKDKDLIKDVDGNIIGIKPHNVEDGYVTIGNGHIIQTEEDAIKYGFTETLADGTVRVMPTDGSLTAEQADEWITKQVEQQGSDLDNPAIFSPQEAGALLNDDISEDYRATAERHAANASGAPFSENEMDAMTSVLYNGNVADDPDGVLYYMLRRDKAGALDAIRKAKDGGDYAGREGVFRRRLMEVNIFFNNDYEFYDDNRLDKLIEDVGY